MEHFTWIIESATGVESATVNSFRLNCHCLQFPTLKGLAQAEIIKKSVILFRVINMTI